MCGEECGDGGGDSGDHEVRSGVFAAGSGVSGGAIAVHDGGHGVRVVLTAGR